MKGSIENPWTCRDTEKRCPVKAGQFYTVHGCWYVAVRDGDVSDGGTPYHAKPGEETFHSLGECSPEEAKKRAELLFAKWNLRPSPKSKTIRGLLSLSEKASEEDVLNRIEELVATASLVGHASSLMEHELGDIS